jgi:hypothetical protein
MALRNEKISSTEPKLQNLPFFWVMFSTHEATFYGNYEEINPVFNTRWSLCGLELWTQKSRVRFLALSDFLVRISEKLLERNGSGSGLENRD